MTPKEWLSTALTPSNIVALLCAIAVFIMGADRFKGQTERDIVEIKAELKTQKDQWKMDKAEQLLRRQKRAVFQGCVIRHDDIYRRELRVQVPCELKGEE